jgi:hypothetical protein
MTSIFIENKKQAQQIFNYCKSRLPILEGFDLTIQTPTDPVIENEARSGVQLILEHEKKVISNWIGTDEDDALLCIYRDLVYHFKHLAEQK